MVLRVAATGDSRAITIRDHVLPVVRKHGVLRDLDRKDSTLRLIVLERDGWVFTHWTPFNSLDPTQAASPAYRRAIERQRSRPGLDYGLDIVAAKKRVLGVLWADDGSLSVTTFVRGAWEEEALSM